MAIIRSDRLKLHADSPAQREALAGTLTLYRRLVRDLMSVAFTHWPCVGSSEGNAVVLIMEGLMHPTSKRPSVRYSYFHRRYYKFPSYLRRVAIMDAIGQVRSFLSRYGHWLDRQRLNRLADNEAHQISRKLINLTLEHECQAVVAENLKNWRPKAGRKRSPMRARFHRWFHRMLITRLKSKAQETGLRSALVYARGTSIQAFDGSGPVKRDATNYSLCTFATGKRYHADLNAAYNVAARGILYFQGNRRKPVSRAGQPKSARTPRTPVTLSTLWLNAEVA